MPLGCTLFGHQWHHGGPYEVRLTSETGPVTPFHCTVCGSERGLALEQGDWLDW